MVRVHVLILMHFQDLDYNIVKNNKGAVVGTVTSNGLNVTYSGTLALSFSFFFQLLMSDCRNCQV